MDDALRCPVCGNAENTQFAVARDIEYFTSAELWQYRHCRSCDAVFLREPPAGRLQEIYPPSYYSLGGEQPTLAVRVKERLDRRALKKALAPIAGETLAVLDGGGGSGWMLDVARAADARVGITVEVDIDEAARARAEAAGHRFVCSRIEDVEFEERFDLILLLNVIEHVTDARRVLQKLGGLLAPGGRILIKTPNHRTLDCRIFQHRNWGGFHCPRHFVLFTAEGLSQLASEVGLRCLSVHYTQGAPQWAVSILGVLHAGGWIRASRERPLHRHPLYGPIAMAAAAFDYARMPFSRTAQMVLTLGAEA